MRNHAVRGSGPRFAEIYQQLGLAWEFLALQCRHWNGYRQIAEGKEACGICGKIKGADERWLLLPRQGVKSVGRRTVPTSRRIFANQRAARVLDDRMDFHGAKLRVEVQNAHRSSLFGARHDITVAADRMVRLVEGQIECSVDANLVSIKLRPLWPKTGLPYGAFPWELPRKLLHNFPVILEYDRRRRFAGLTILRPTGLRGRRRRPGEP